MKRMSCFFIILVILTISCSFCQLIAMDHYDKLITSYCNYYKNIAQLNENELKEYTIHFTNQCINGGSLFYRIQNSNLEKLELNFPEKRLSILCKIICFLYRQGLTENNDPDKNGLYSVDFQVNDPRKKIYKILIEKYYKLTAKKLVCEYEAEYLNKKVKFYEFFVNTIVEKKPLLPWGHSYIRIYWDHENKKVHIRTHENTYYSINNGISYLYNQYIKDTRDTYGYKKVHVPKKIMEHFKKFFIQKKEFTLSEIITFLEKNKDTSDYTKEIEELIKEINKRYRYPKKLYGNEIYIDSRDLLSISSYLDHLKIINKNNDAEDFAKIVKPFLNLDMMIFDYNNFGKFSIEEEIYNETEVLRSYVKESVISCKKKIQKLPLPYQKYLSEIIAILELIFKTKTPDKYLLYTHIFDSEEHKQLTSLLQEEINSYKKSLYPDLSPLKKREEEDNELKTTLEELTSEINKEKANNNSSKETEGSQETEDVVDDQSFDSFSGSEN